MRIMLQSALAPGNPVLNKYSTKPQILQYTLKKSVICKVIVEFNSSQISLINS